MRRRAWILGIDLLVVERPLVVAGLLGVLLRHPVQRLAQMQGGDPRRRPLVVDDLQELLADRFRRKYRGGRAAHDLWGGQGEEEDEKGRLNHGC